MVNSENSFKKMPIKIHIPKLVPYVKKEDQRMKTKHSYTRLYLISAASEYRIAFNEKIKY